MLAQELQRTQDGAYNKHPASKVRFCCLVFVKDRSGTNGTQTQTSSSSVIFLTRPPKVDNKHLKALQRRKKQATKVLGPAQSSAGVFSPAAKRPHTGDSWRQERAETRLNTTVHLSLGNVLSPEMCVSSAAPAGGPRPLERKQSKTHHQLRPRRPTPNSRPSLFLTMSHRKRTYFCFCHVSLSHCAVTR